MTYCTSPRSLLRVVLLALILGGTACGVQAQTTGGHTEPSTLDKRLLDRLYSIESPAFRGTMRGADATAWPVFYAGAASAWIGIGIVRGSDDFSDAYRLSVSELSTLGAAMGLKYLVRRTRPYVRFPDLDSRAGDIARGDPYSFPSGHAAISFALATSWTLSHPEWYVAVPGYLWATTVALSRVWLGVHYPSDVFFGAVLGMAIAWGVHELGSAITPEALRNDDDASPTPLLHLRFLLN